MGGDEPGEGGSVTEVEKQEVDCRDNVKYNKKNDQLFVKMTMKVDDKRVTTR